MNTQGSIVLSKLLSPASVNLNLKGTDRDGVLEELVNQVSEIAKQPDARQTLLKALHERTKVPVAEYIRQGIDLVLDKYRDQLPGQVDLRLPSR